MTTPVFDNPSDTRILEILRETRVIALVGASPNPERPSHQVGQFLVRMGYRVIPVNPGIAGKQLFGEMVYASLGDIPDNITIDMVDIFRRSDRVEPVVQSMLSLRPNLPRVIWMQIGVVNPVAAQAARAAGIEVVQNRCPKIEYTRLIGTSPLA
jgi:predicted CoA-binding protein